MWSFRSEQLPDNGGLCFAVNRNSRPASFADVVWAWTDDASVRALFNARLAGTPCSAFRRETPPATESTVTRPCEFVVLDSPGLADPDWRDATERRIAAVLTPWLSDRPRGANFRLGERACEEQPPTSCC